MRENFFGYIPYREKDFKELWKDATFVFDTNILLNFYRYPNDIKEQIFTRIEEVSDRIWIPHQTAKEFFNNRVKVIVEQENIYKNFKKNIRLSKQDDAIKKLRHSSLSTRKDEMLNVLKECEEKLIKIIDEEKNESLINNDKILDRILKIFDGKLGEKINEEKYMKYTKEIDERYEKNIPPGYKDKDKDKDENKDKDRKYGDAINWLEVIDFSKKNGKHIIYITDDKKEDWFEKRDDREIGPRKELLHEFFSKTGKKIYIYDTTMFLRGFDKYISSEDIIDEKDLAEINYINDYVNDDNLYNKCIKYKLKKSDDYEIDLRKNLINRMIKSENYNRKLVAEEQGIKNLNESFKNYVSNQNVDYNLCEFQENLKKLLDLYSKSKN